VACAPGAAAAGWQGRRAGPEGPRRLHLAAGWLERRPAPALPPRPRRCLVLLGETGPPEGAHSSCWAPSAAGSFAPSSSPPPSIDLGFGEETRASRRVGWQRGLEEGSAGRREAPAGCEQPSGGAGGRISRGGGWKRSRVREVACPLVLRRREYFGLFFCFSFFLAEAGIEPGLLRGRKCAGAGVSLKPASNFHQQPSDLVWMVY
jgi:hypothetical protein